VPGDDRKISSLACVFLVTLRLAIGWHLLYEGLWKIHSQSTAQPWSSEGYLKNASGPLRDYFRGLTGDPNDYRWLDYDAMVEKWDDWHARYLEHYPGVTDGQGAANVANRLHTLINGQPDFRVALEALPEGVDLSKWKNAIKFDAKAKRLIVDGKYHLLPGERDDILALAPAIPEPTAEQTPNAAIIAKFRKAVEDVYKLQSKLSYKERLAALLKGDPERVGVLQKEKGDGGAVIEQRLGEIALYKAQVERYEANLAKVKTSFQWDHLQRQWGELQTLRRKLIGPVQALESELKIEAEKLLSTEQLSAGPVPERMTPIRALNLQTMWGLTIIGTLLIAGLFTRIAAVAGAFLLANFYMAVPPWPNCPPEPGPDHSLVVNKVFLESLTCLTLATLPTGKWFGIDALINVLFWRKRTK
jgi:uncharacterized membrane protein YphA (DoxX/SURF4 family)